MQQCLQLCAHEAPHLQCHFITSYYKDGRCHLFHGSAKEVALDNRFLTSATISCSFTWKWRVEKLRCHKKANGGCGAIRRWIEWQPVFFHRTPSFLILVDLFFRVLENFYLGCNFMILKDWKTWRHSKFSSTLNVLIHMACILHNIYHHNLLLLILPLAYCKENIW